MQEIWEKSKLVHKSAPVIWEPPKREQVGLYHVMYISRFTYNLFTFMYFKNLKYSSQNKELPCVSYDNAYNLICIQTKFLEKIVSIIHT